MTSKVESIKLTVVGYNINGNRVYKTPMRKETVEYVLFNDKDIADLVEKLTKILEKYE